MKLDMSFLYFISSWIWFAALFVQLAPNKFRDISFSALILVAIALVIDLVAVILSLQGFK